MECDDPVILIYSISPHSHHGLHVETLGQVALLRCILPTAAPLGFGLFLKWDRPSSSPAPSLLASHPNQYLTAVACFK